MPAHAADLDTALQKKGGLTLSQLANYDDLITDALVDRVSVHREHCAAHISRAQRSQG